MQTLWQDIRYGVRTLAKRPGFALIAIVTLGLGIGGCTSIFTVVNGVLLNSLPYPHPERLYALSETSKEVPVMSVAYPNYLDWCSQQTAFENLAAWMPTGGVFTGGREPERVIGREVTANFFPTLGVQPPVGRFFNEDDNKPGAEPVMVLSHGLWQRRFGGDPDLIGKPILYNSEIWTVIGVTAPDFDYYGTDNANNGFFLPLGRLANREYMQDRNSHPVWVTARSKPGVTREQARVEIEAIAARLERAYPASNTGNGVDLRSHLDDYVGEVRTPLQVLSAAVAVLLLIACANVANFLLARAAARRREIALRMALGAGRLRIVRQLLTESMILALGGGVLGLLLAAWGVELLVKISPDSLPRLEEITVDPRALGFTLLVTMLTAAICGLAPALQTSRVDVQEALKEGGRQLSSGGGVRRLRTALVVAEVALSLVLLVGAGLLVKSFQQLMKVDAGFDARNVLTLRLRLPDAKYRDATQTTGFLREAVRRIGSLPGVDQVAIGTGFPLGPGGENGYWIEGQPEPRQPGDWPVALSQSVSEGYHRTLAISLVNGRYFTEQDTSASPPVVIVDTEFVNRHFAGDVDDVLGRRLRFGGEGEPWREIVGVVGHVRHYGLDAEGRAGIYRPWTQINSRWLAEFTRAMDLVVKTSVEPTSLVGSIKQEVQAVDKDQPLANVRTLESLLARSTAPRRFNLLLLGLFAVVALLLGTVGLYGVMSYWVTQRAHEIGIRMALGAQTRQVLKLVVQQGMALALGGVAIGLLGAFALTRFMESLLYNVSASDPLTFISVAILLSFVALLACWIPARRAAQVDPMIALRYE